ncbi:hypothetical protein [Lentzea terrae]|uniref:hypothetical protein n=1 Tax=Lentzea terrae TaxID=2200761 RepID=UPI0013004A12|nr:hypothetical protein [Lentzea terrae]
MPSVLIAPYITAWSAEQDLPCVLVEWPDRGIGYANELLSDRDRHGVLWQQTALRHRVGWPEFTRVRPLRQRRAMELLLCQVCGGPADRNDDGVLWLQRDHRDDWPQWPEGMASMEPPVCLTCVPVAMQMCPVLRRGAVLVHVREYQIAGVRGALYRRSVLAPSAIVAGNFTYDDPAVRRVLASALIRELRGCTTVSFEELHAVGKERFSPVTTRGMSRSDSSNSGASGRLISWMIRYSCTHRSNPRSSLNRMTNVTSFLSP